MMRRLFLQKSVSYEAVISIISNPSREIVKYTLSFVFSNAFYVV
jgi:hypothetical protein